MNELLLLSGVGILLLAFAQHRLHATDSQASFKSDEVWRADLVSLRRRYLCGYIPAMLADWIMGAHIYALYQSFGYSMHDIALLFMIGFGSSLSLGTMISAAADEHGRRQGCVWYCIAYTLSALANNSQQWPMLCLSRMLGGIATSLLYSCYEAWLVDEHTRLGLPAETLGPLFSQTTFFNALSAIAGGLIAEAAAAVGGLHMPFNVAVVPLVCSAVATCTLWRENYGQRSASSGGMYEAAAIVCAQPPLLVIGFLSAVFEASMFVFIFLWTPSLELRLVDSQKVHFGLVFALFMVWKMVGSCAYQLVHLPGHQSMRTVSVPFVLGALALVVPVLSMSFLAVLTACAVFEACVGWYWPMIAELRAVRIPEGSRVTTMALFRMPLNLMVIGCMCEMGRWSEAQTYSLCAAALVLVLVVFQWTEARNKKPAILCVSTGSQFEDSAFTKSVSSRSSPSWRRRNADHEGVSSLSLDADKLV